MATGAMRVVANEQQKIIFKGALKINCAVPLTQSPSCCMVSSSVGISLLSSWYLMSVGFFDGLQIALQMLFESSSIQLRSEPYVRDTSSITVLEPIHSKAETGKNVEEILRVKSSVNIVWQAIRLFPAFSKMAWSCIRLLMYGMYHAFLYVHCVRQHQKHFSLTNFFLPSFPLPFLRYSGLELKLLMRRAPIYAVVLPETEG